MRIVAWKSTLTPLLLLCLAGCASASSQDRTDQTRPEFTALLAQLERNPFEPDEALRITKLVESPELSGLLVQVRGWRPALFHKRPREIVHLISAKGIFQRDTGRI